MSSTTHDHSGHDHSGEVRTYLIVYVALLVLLFSTVGLAFMPVGAHHALRDLLTAVGLLIAATKAVLIILWFMHVKASSRLTWMFAASGFVWLVIMFGLSLNDYMSRGELPTQGGFSSQQSGASGETQEFRPDDSSGTYYKR